jgi:hypothetical protein
VIDLDLLTQVKILLGIATDDTSQDGILTYICNFVTGLALRYCKLTVATDDINFVLAGMVTERYRANGYGQQASPQIVESITTGKETVHFMKLRNAPENFILSNELTDGEKTMLTSFRKLWP